MLQQDMLTHALTAMCTSEHMELSCASG